MSNKKLLTPMSRLKSHFHLFGALGEHLFNGVDVPLELNHKNAGYNPYGGETGYGAPTKEVQSDFIRIYKMGRCDSIAFKFTYLNEDKITISEHQFMEIQLKSVDNYYNSKIMDIEESKQAMRKINNFLDNFSLDISTIEFWQFIQTNFILTNEASEADFEEYKESFKKDTKLLFNKHKTLIQDRAELDVLIRNNNREFVNFKTNLPEQKEINLLKEQIKKCQTKINLKAVQKHRELEINENNQLLENIDRVIEELKHTIITSSRILNNKFKLPFAVIDKFTKSLFKSKR